MLLVQRQQYVLFTRAHPSLPIRALMPQLLNSERNLIDKLVRSQRKTPIEAWKALKKARAKKTGSRKCSLSKQSVYNYVHGHTHRSDKKETRGRRKNLTGADVRKLLQTRRRLIKKASNLKRVRYSDIITAAKLKKQVCERTVADRMRARGCKYRPARKKLYLVEKETNAFERPARKELRIPLLAVRPTCSEFTDPTAVAMHADPTTRPTSDTH